MRSNKRKRKVPLFSKNDIEIARERPEVTLVAYDENLLERTRTQWQFGDWTSLAKLDRQPLQHHPDRAKLALMAAAGHLQTNSLEEAMRYIRLAKDWGCSNKLIVQILAAGAHNSLGRAAAQTGQQHRAYEHFEQSILLGTPGSDANLLAQARARHQYTLLDLHTPVQRSLLAASAPCETIAPAVSYLVTIRLRINNDPIVKLGFNSGKTACLAVQPEAVEYRTENGAPLYLVSNEDGRFEKPPRNPQIHITAGNSYIFYGEIACSGDNRPVVWIFQYGGGKKIDAQSITSTNGHFRHNIKTLANAESFAFGIRLAGNGSLIPGDTIFTLQELGNQAVSVYLDEKVETIKQAQKRDIENSMKQLEACIRLQHYLGADIILPDMHNWPISPDFGVLLINLVEQNGYDAVIEFGSGTSTLILAKALERTGRSTGRVSPLLSFDHLDEYRSKTLKLLERAELLEHASVSLSPLAPWQDEHGNPFSYYDCTEALLTLKRQLPDAATRILVVVDGPPAMTGRNARYPALPKILEVFPPEKYTSHLLLDDYVRTEEQEIAKRWQEDLSSRTTPHSLTEFKKLEKQACLIEIRPDVHGENE